MILTIRLSDRIRGFCIEAWKYWEIIDELRSRGISKEQAYAAAEWAARTRTSGAYTDIPGWILTVK